VLRRSKGGQAEFQGEIGKPAALPERKDFPREKSSEVENRRAGVDYKTCFRSIDSRLAEREDRLAGMKVRSAVMIWTVGINAIAPAGGRRYRTAVLFRE
jgi:hypothetical protein